MGKKKGNKAETNGEVDVDEIENDGPETAPSAGKKGKKSKKKKEDYDEDDIADELEELKLEEGGEEIDEKDEEPAPEKKNKKEKKKSKKKVVSSDEESEEEAVVIKPKMGGGFAALMMDDDDDDDIDEEEDEEEEEQVVVQEKLKPKKDKKKKENKTDGAEDMDTAPPPTPTTMDEEKGKKGKKGKKKKKDADDDEDIDALLAEIEAEHRGEKPKPKEEEKKDDDSENKPEDAPLAEEENKKKKKKKKGQSEEAPELSTDAKSEAIIQEGDGEKADDAVEESSKKKKKKKKAKDAAAASENKDSKEGTPAPEGSKEGTPTPDDKDGGDDDDDEESSGKKKKKKGEKDEKKPKGKVGNKMLAAMREELARQEAEKERNRLQEEDEDRKEDERIKAAEEAKKLEEERKERKKQKEKERKERLRAEGKLLTKAQKQAQQRAQEMLEHLRAQGVELPGEGEKRPRAGTRVRPGKKNKKDQQQQQEEKQDEKEEVVEEKMVVEDASKVEEVKVEEEEEIKDAWDVSSDEEEEKPEIKKEEIKKIKKEEAEDEDEDEDDDEEESEEESSEEDESDDDNMTEAEKRRAKAETRIEKRKVENEKNRDPDTLRAPVVCVLGHVDHGKTKILDKLRKTNVQDGEVGGITQQIGATNVPMDAVRSQTRMAKDFDINELKFPGLLIIDTPGHESFRNLRNRGSSMCDIAILVVDITQGLEPQTIESINLLKKRKTPFVVALNKVDRVFEWESHPSKDIRETILTQNESSKNDFTRRTNEIMLALNEEGLNAALFWENPDPRSYVSLVPTSAISGDGMGNLIAMICQMCQERLAPRLIFTEQLQCIVLEVKTIAGHGVTIDVILINGRLHAGDTIILAGTDGPIVTQIRALLLPQPMKEIRVKGQYSEFKEIAAAQGVKIAAKEMEKAIAGLELLVAQHEDEVEIHREKADKEFKTAMRSIKVKDQGVYVQASTLGALEALLEFFKVNKVPYSGVRVGPVVKRDVMKAAAMLEHDPMYAAILAFDVKVEKDAQELADKEGVKIFSEETIYHLGDRYVDYIKEYKKKKQDEFKNVAVFPCRIKIIPTAIFNNRNPIVMGVSVEQGILRTGTPLCVPSKEFCEIGIVTSLEFDHKNVDMAKKGVDVCIKIEPAPGHTPKLFGRHFEATDQLVSKITRESINACKDYFRDDLGKPEWKLMAELKKEFQIL